MKSSRMVHLSDDQINDIAQDLDSGFVCYINIRTGEHLTVPNDYDSWDTDAFDADVAEVKKHKKLYLEIEPPMSGDSFRIMEGFIDSLPANAHGLQARLIEALNKPKPFRNFKYVIDNSGPYREQWFAYKNQQLIEFVKRELGIERNED